MLVAEAVEASDRFDHQAEVITPVKDAKKMPSYNHNYQGGN
jgi:hypothetical protein